MKRRDFITMLALISPAPFLWWRKTSGPGEAAIDPSSAFAASSAPGAALPARAEITLPAWFDNARIQAHTRLSHRLRGTPVFARAGEAVKALGATVLTRYVKAGSEPPMWPSRATGGAPVAKDNPIAEFNAEAQKHGVRIIGYYWHVADEAYTKSQPDWVCLGQNGKPAAHRRGSFLDITGPYREVVLQRLLELAKFGTSGFYFDFTHVPLTGCRGTELEREFTRTTGIKLPRRLADTDTDAQKFHRFTADRLAQTFQYWRAEVKKQYPDVVFIVSVSYLPSLLLNRMNTDLARVADSAKTEYRQALITRASEVFQGRNAPARPRNEHRMALGWALVRDSADGRPHHVWAPGFADVASSRAAVGAIMGFGGIANIDIDENALLQPRAAADRNDRNVVQAAIQLGNRINPAMASTRPERWAAVLISESARDAREGNIQRAWREVLLPQIGAFGVFIDAGLSTGTVDDKQLAAGDLDGIRLLYVADSRALSPAQRSTLDGFRARGGIVIQQNAAWNWASDPAAAAAAMHAHIAPELAAAPVRVTAASGNAYAGAFRSQDGGRLVIPIINDFAWVRVSRSNPERDEVARERQPEIAALREPAPLRNVRVQVKSQRVPRRISEAVSGATLTVERTGDVYSIALPSVDQSAFVVFEF